MNPQERLAHDLQAFFAGHADSLDRIARDSQTEVLRMIDAALGRHARRSTHEQLDVCQQLYLTLWQRQHSAHPPILNVLAYFQRLIRNIVHQRRRHRFADRRHEGRTESLDARTARDLPREDPQLASPERRELVRAAVRALGTRDRVIVALRAHGASWHEISQKLHDNPESLRASYRRALARLRRRLRDR